MCILPLRTDARYVLVVLFKLILLSDGWSTTDLELSIFDIGTSLLANDVRSDVPIDVTSKFTDIKSGYSNWLSIAINGTSSFLSIDSNLMPVDWTCLIWRWSFSDDTVTRIRNVRFACRLNRRSCSVRWCRFMLSVLVSVINIKSKPKLKPVHRHFWKPASLRIRPHRKQLLRNEFWSQSLGLHG